MRAGRAAAGIGKTEMHSKAEAVERPLTEWAVNGAQDALSCGLVLQSID